MKEKCNDNVCLIIIGNKNDLKDERQVQSDSALEKAKILNVPFMETSALDGNGVKEAFFCLIRQMYDVFLGERKKESNKEGGQKMDEGVQLNKKQQDKKGCC